MASIWMYLWQKEESNGQTLHRSKAIKKTSSLKPWGRLLDTLREKMLLLATAEQIYSSELKREAGEFKYEMSGIQTLCSSCKNTSQT